MSSSLISLALFKKKSMINFVAITWRMPGGGCSSSHLLPDNMAQNEKRCYRHRATCTSASRLAHVMLCKQYSPHVRMSPQKGTHPQHQTVFLSQPHVSQRQSTGQQFMTEFLAFQMKRTTELTRLYCPGGGTTPSCCMRLMVSINTRLFLHWPAAQ